MFEVRTRFLRRLPRSVTRPLPVIALAVGGLIAVSVVLGAAQDHPARARSPIEEEVIAAQQAQITANNAADIPALDRMTATDWIGVSAAGVVRDKTQFLQDVSKRGPAKVQRTAQDAADRQKEWRVQVHGNTGIVTRMTAGDHGSRIWNTAVWVKRDGAWLRVFSQETTAPPP
jgi:Domain of unknown function (DUF4440)